MNLTAEGPLKPVFDAAKNLHNEFVKLEKDMIASGTDLKGYYQALIDTVKQQDLKTTKGQTRLNSQTTQITTNSLRIIKKISLTLRSLNKKPKKS